MRFYFCISIISSLAVLTGCSDIVEPSNSWTFAEEAVPVDELRGYSCMSMGSHSTTDLIADLQSSSTCVEVNLVWPPDYGTSNNREVDVSELILPAGLGVSGISRWTENCDSDRDSANATSPTLVTGEIESHADTNESPGYYELNIELHFAGDEGPGEVVSIVGKVSSEDVEENCGV